MAINVTIFRRGRPRTRRSQAPSPIGTPRAGAADGPSPLLQRLRPAFRWQASLCLRRSDANPPKRPGRRKTVQIHLILPNPGAQKSLEKNREKNKPCKIILRWICTVVLLPQPPGETAHPPSFHISQVSRKTWSAARAAKPGPSARRIRRPAARRAAPRAECRGRKRNVKENRRKGILGINSREAPAFSRDSPSCRPPFWEEILYVYVLFSPLTPAEWPQGVAGGVRRATGKAPEGNAVGGRNKIKTHHHHCHHQPSPPSPSSP